MRRASTDVEAKLWSRLRSRGLGGFKFVRQEPIGRYFADFACREVRLVLEVDGGQHADSKSDETRDAALRMLGWRVIRVWNNDVIENIEGVLEMLLLELGSGTSPSPRPSPRKRVEGAE